MYKAAKPSGAKNNMKVGVSTPVTWSQVRQCHNADHFAPNELAKAILDATSGKSSVVETAALSPHPIISIGANTDAVLDQFSLSDQIIPRLCKLVATIRSSCWEVILWNPSWNLNYEQAANLQRAFHADLEVDMLLSNVRNIFVCLSYSTNIFSIRCLLVSGKLSWNFFCHCSLLLLLLFFTICSGPKSF